MAKIKLETRDQFNDFANEVQEALAELKQALEEMKKEVENIKNESTKKQKKEDSFWS